MMFHFFRRNPSNRSIAALYGMIVAQARTAAFYRSYGVPDTVNGRFEMVVLHAVLVLRRLESEPAPVRGLGQALFDRFCADMDGNLREMGVGDLAVPDRMRRIGEAFYGRQAAYAAALAASEPRAARRGACAQRIRRRERNRARRRRGWQLMCGRRRAARRSGRPGAWDARSSISRSRSNHGHAAT